RPWTKAFDISRGDQLHRHAPLPSLRGFAFHWLARAASTRSEFVSTLTPRAAHGCPSVDCVCPDESRTAPHASLATASVRLKLFCKSAALASRIAVVTKARSSRFNRLLENVDDFAPQKLNLFRSDRLRCAGRVDTRAPQRFIGVDVSNSR